MNTISRTAGILLAPLLFLALLSCGSEPAANRAPRPAAGSYFDFIAAFDPSQAKLGRRTDFGWRHCRYLDSGFDLEDNGPGVPVQGRGVLRFDCPWGTEPFELELIMRADPPCQVLVTLNGRILGRPELKRGPTGHAWTVGADDLLPRNNLVVIETPDSSQVRLNRLVLPLAELSGVLGQRRVPLLPAMPPTRIRYRVRPEAGSRLAFETYYHRAPARPPEGVIHFEIMAVCPPRKEKIFSREVRVGTDGAGEVMEPAQVDLTPFAGSEIQLIFNTSFAGQTHWPMAGEIGWGHPRMLPARDGGGPQPPLIIWLVDTLRADHLSCYGYSRDTSPNMDALAREGLRFERVSAQSSWTRPSIASLLTGLYPSSHGAMGREDRILPDVTTLAQHLKSHGYTTATFSANGNFYAEDLGLTRGFDEVWGYWVPPEDDNWMGMKQALLDDLFLWLQRNAGERVFLFIHTIDPHDPYAPPAPYDTRFTGNYSGAYQDHADVLTLRNHAAQAEPDFDRHRRQAVDLYDGEIAFNDENFGRFVERLRETGFYDRSVLVVTSDHGEEFSDHSGWGHGRTLYGEQIELPLIIRLPGGRHAGRVVEERIRQVDLMPSLMHWLDLPAPPSAGVNVAADLDAGRRPTSGEVLAEESLDNHVLYSLIEGRYKYILRLEPWREEALYDIESDPLERENIIVAHPRIAEGMAERVAAYRIEAEAVRQSRDDREPVRLTADEIANLKALGYLQ